MSSPKARLILEDGRVFPCTIFASSSDRYAEIVFNTAMVGYQEVLTDPSYAGQAVVMTYPMIGNYGINDEDMESQKIHLEALIVKEYVDEPSSWRSTQTLKEFLSENNVMGVEGVDTRALTRHIRQKGAIKGAITSSQEPASVFVDRLKKIHLTQQMNSVRFVSCDKSYHWPPPQNIKFRVAVIDCGIKHNILHILRKLGCHCVIYNHNVYADKILQEKYDGVFLSNGPGDPSTVYEVVETTKKLLGKIPLFGICLGHQIIAQALGCKTFKLKFGHHGINHPIQNIQKGSVEITSQNHNYAIEPSSLNSEIEVTHIHLNDRTIAGLKHKIYPLFSVQYHPEASPGPNDSQYLFRNFIKMMTEYRQDSLNPKRWAHHSNQSQQNTLQNHLQ